MLTRVLLNPPLRLLIPLVSFCLRALGGSFLALLWFLLLLEPIVVCLKCCKTDHLYTLSLLSCSFPKFRPTFGVLYSAITWEGAFFRVLKLFIWHARNDFAFAIFVLDLPQSSRMLNLTLALIFLCIPKVCIFKRQNFHRQWGGCGAVASVVRGCFTCSALILAFV